MPRAGGLEDQPIGYIDRMAWASATYSAFRGYYSARNVIGWIDSNQDAYDLYGEVKQMLVKDGLI